MVLVAAAACPRCGIRVERTTTADNLPFRAICRSCGAHVTLLHPREANGKNGQVRRCLDCEGVLPVERAGRNYVGLTPGVRLWVCTLCRARHNLGEPGADISRSIYLWNVRNRGHGQVDS